MSQNYLFPIVDIHVSENDDSENIVMTFVIIFNTADDWPISNAGNNAMVIIV